MKFKGILSVLFILFAHQLFAQHTREDRWVYYKDPPSKAIKIPAKIVEADENNSLEEGCNDTWRPLDEDKVLEFDISEWQEFDNFNPNNIFVSASDEESQDIFSYWSKLQEADENQDLTGSRIIALRSVNNFLSSKIRFCLGAKVHNAYIDNPGNPSPEIQLKKIFLWYHSSKIEAAIHGNFAWWPKFVQCELAGAWYVKVPNGSEYIWAETGPHICNSIPSQCIPN